jgi:hypothetical protein
MTAGTGYNNIIISVKNEEERRKEKKKLSMLEKHGWETLGHARSLRSRMSLQVG